MTVSPASVWVVIAVAALGTFALRASFLFLLGRVEGVPPRVERALRFVPAAVLAALVTPAFLRVGGEPLSATPTVRGLLAAVTGPRFLAGALAVAVAHRTESILATIVAGLLALLLLQATLPG